MSDTQDDDSDDSLLSAEMADRAERRARKEKERREEAARKIPDNIEAAIEQGKLAEAQKAQRKKLFNYGLMGVGALLFGFLIYWLFVPYKAGLTYGVCKVFLELNTRFPQSLHLSTVEERENIVRIWYTQTDAFGQYRMENIECHYVADEATGGRLDKVTINRLSVDPAKVAAFNKTLPIIFENPPDLTIPRPLPDSLKGLQINTQDFRQRLNIRR